MNRIQKLTDLGQSVWYDNIQRRLLQNGELDDMIRRGEIRGVTSNPSIFHNAISKSSDYDSAIQPMTWAGWNAEQIFNQLAIEDIRAAADLFKPLYENSRGADGFVSLEVSPYLANDTQATIAEAQHLWKTVNRPNLMIKIPATKAGIEAVRKTIACGINVNVTLIFSLSRYEEVMEAYLAGLEDRAAADLPIDKIASVASFFVSRVDTKVDARLQQIIQKGGTEADQAKRLLGKAAIANARLAYARSREVFSTPRFQKLQQLGARIQRPLWASTSTKNPTYRDVIYVEELIGPDTVNTVPPQTLDAFRDHGEASTTLAGRAEEAARDLAAIASSGISLDEITIQLEIEGVKAFADAFTALLETLEQRRACVQAQLGSIAPDVSAAVATLSANLAARRLYAHDPSLWTQRQSAYPEILNRLGWLDAPLASRTQLAELNEVAAECQIDNYTHALLLGMGGSSLAPEVFAMTFGVREDIGGLGLQVSILDSTDPAQVHEAARKNPVKSTLYVVSSKSGDTSEVNAMLAYFWQLAVNETGEDACRHFVAVTDPGTPLERLAQERNFRRVVRGNPQVGGRYSALTAFGLLPAALQGIDIRRLLDHASVMAEQCGPEVPPERSPALVLGAILGAAALKGRDKLTILADSIFSSFGSWLEQLIAESSGKENKGIVPIDLEPLGAPRSYDADRLFVYLRAAGELDEKVAALRKAGHPVIEIALKDEYDLGGEFFRWEAATAYACALLEVNPFDQPDVQDNKTRTLQKIEAYHRDGNLAENTPAWENEYGAVYGPAYPGLAEAQDLHQALTAFLVQAGPGDYVAVNAYLPRDLKHFSQLQKLRDSIRKTTGKATTLGFGPRFLHSTGQLHKGGGDNGLFLQITADPARDVEIPGQKLSFGTLERAQALGDLEALVSRGRRAVRFHLKRGVEDLLK